MWEGAGNQELYKGRQWGVGVGVLQARAPSQTNLNLNPNCTKKFETLSDFAVPQLPLQ